MVFILTKLIDFDGNEIPEFKKILDIVEFLERLVSIIEGYARSMRALLNEYEKYRSAKNLGLLKEKIEIVLNNTIKRLIDHRKDLKHII